MSKKNRRDTLGSRKQLDGVLIVTEGRETERNYLNHANRYLGRKKVEIKCDSNTAPDQLLLKAIKILDQNKQVRSSVGSSFFPSSFDSAWIVFDRNGNEPEQINDVIKKAKRENIKTAFSQPCFELWLLLHFVYSTREFSDCSEVTDVLMKHDTSYSKSGRFESYMPKIHDAIINSKKLFLFAKENQTRSKSFTTVHELVEYLNS